MAGIGERTKRAGTTLTLAGRALRAWGPQQVLVALLAAAVVALVIGLATVLIPNPVFSREIPTLAWNYPVWILTSALMGMLVATYVRPPLSPVEDARATDTEARHGERDDSQRRSARVGGVAGILAWFAVGCPVCNKLALLALGYTGALTWFAPLQPFLAGIALVLSVLALVWRLRGQVACPMPATTAPAVPA